MWLLKVLLHRHIKHLRRRFTQWRPLCSYILSVIAGAGLHSSLKLGDEFKTIVKGYFQNI